MSAWYGGFVCCSPDFDMHKVIDERLKQATTTDTVLPGDSAGH
jgi:hypothetical protein